MIKLGDTLKKAKALVTGSRQKMYGDPKPLHQTAGAMWGAYLRAKGWTGPELAPQDVALMMSVLKISREAHRHQPDNLPDAAGFVDLAAHMESRS